MVYKEDPNELFFIKKQKEIKKMIIEYLNQNCAEFKKDKEIEKFKSKYDNIWDNFYVPEIKENPIQMTDGLNYSNNTSNYSTGGKSNISIHSNLSLTKNYSENNSK